MQIMKQAFDSIPLLDRIKVSKVLLLRTALPIASPPSLPRELHDKSKYNKVVFDDKEFPSATALDSRIMFQPNFNISGKKRKVRKKRILERQNILNLRVYDNLRV